jgi:hypothetical protein
MRKVIVTAIAALALTGTFASTASADVLVNSPNSHPYCGDAIKVGTWAQAWTTGSRKVTITARYLDTGGVWWRKRVTASKKRWKFFYIAPPGCRDIRITYSGPGWATSFRVYFGTGD